MSEIEIPVRWRWGDGEVWRWKEFLRLLELAVWLVGLEEQRLGSWKSLDETSLVSSCIMDVILEVFSEFKEIGC